MEPEVWGHHPTLIPESHGVLAAWTTPDHKKKPRTWRMGAGSSQVWPAVTRDPVSNLVGAQDEGSQAHSPAAQCFAGIPVHQAPD